MAEFFTFIVSMLKDLVALYFELPFMEGISYGDMLVAILVLGVISSALIGQLRGFSLTHEASEANRMDAIQSRLGSRSLENKE